MIRPQQRAVNWVILSLLLATGCSQTLQSQSDVYPSSQPSAESSSVTAAAPTEANLPNADNNGDYSKKTSHKKWIVVDSDPNGVNCRWSQEMPTNWYAPDAKLPRLNISQWSVVRRFQKNTPSQTLNANLTPAGFATLFDESGKPWLKVSIGANEQICFVRANKKYIQPIN